MRLSDKNYLKEAYVYASENSTDKSTQNGAILVNDDGEILAKAANRFPDGVLETEHRWIRPRKYAFVEHAERNVIFNAAKQGIKTEGLTMYCPWAACTDCMRAIIQSGIKKLVVHYEPLAESRFGIPAPEQWRQSILFAIEMLKESGLQLDVVNEKIFENNNFEFLFNGSKITP